MEDKIEEKVDFKYQINTFKINIFYLLKKNII
jgi:hypothetical protein